ncbi:hypothetical protein [Flavobacterium branchiophilum]|uniref:Uncharacterized protein n=1 Tax=Flavobacterium branchiophilum TaxID=55197 RepID=A0A2H3KFA3_9FLAO|nr:hypothetical protein [Flavobacterium branchiophilum]PDS27163.1 hypothetical protein B0A77_00435 [Flavobacterium branchiophilum]
MKFFSKNHLSEIVCKGLVYKKSNPKNNAIIRTILIQEQHNFCAYTEKYFKDLDSVVVEHFDSSKKYQDDYYNYYAVLSKPNLYKKDEKYRNNRFFETKFYQNSEELNNRIQYIKGEFIFETKDENDQEAIDFIAFLGLNHPSLYNQRKKHWERIAAIFENFDATFYLTYFKKHPEELSFITVIENEMNLNLDSFHTL